MFFQKISVFQVYNLSFVVVLQILLYSSLLQFLMLSYLDLFSHSNGSAKLWLVSLIFVVLSVVAFMMSTISCRHLVTIVSSESMLPSLRRGDVLISTPVKTSKSPNVKIGDVVLVQVSIKKLSQCYKQVTRFSVKQFIKNYRI